MPTNYVNNEIQDIDIEPAPSEIIQTNWIPIISNNIGINDSVAHRTMRMREPTNDEIQFPQLRTCKLTIPILEGEKAINFTNLINKTLSLKS